MTNIEFLPELWFLQSDSHFFTNNYRCSYLVCGARWNNKPWRMGKRLTIFPRDSLSGRVVEKYELNQPVQSICHPLGIRILLREEDLIQDPDYLIKHYPKNNIPESYGGFLPKEIPEIHCNVASTSYQWIRRDCQEFGFTREVATAALFWAYKLSGLIDLSFEEMHKDTIYKTVIPSFGPIKIRMREIHENYSDMWKVIAFANWPKWTNQNIKLDERISILNGLGFDLKDSALIDECRNFGVPV